VLKKQEAERALVAAGEAAVVAGAVQHDVLHVGARQRAHMRLNGKPALAGLLRVARAEGYGRAAASPVTGDLLGAGSGAWGQIVTMVGHLRAAGSTLAVLEVRTALKLSQGNMQCSSSRASTLFRCSRSAQTGF